MLFLIVVVAVAVVCVVVSYFIFYRSEGFALTGYDIPGCVEDGAWMLWGNSSVAAAAVVVAHPGLGSEQLSVSLRLRRFRDARIDPLVFRVPTASVIRKVVVGEIKISINRQKNTKNGRNGHRIKIPYKNTALLSP